MVRAAMVDGRWADTQLGEYAAAYLDALEYEEASTNTLAAYEHVLALFCVEHADLALGDLEPPQGAAVVRAFLDRHWRNSAAATRRQRLAIVRSFLRWLVGEGLLRANPAQNVRGPREKRKERRAFAHEDVERLIAAQTSLRDQVALTCLAWLGLRKSELGQLRVRDFNLAAGTVTVHGKGGISTRSRSAFSGSEGPCSCIWSREIRPRRNTCYIRAPTAAGRWIVPPSTAG
jgi:site-specific recombinase XerC